MSKFDRNRIKDGWEKLCTNKQTNRQTDTTKIMVTWPWTRNRVPSKELRERLGIEDIILILQQNRLRWYGHVLRKEDTDWVKKCMEYEVKVSRPRGRPKRTWREVVQEDCQARSLNREDAMGHCRWKKLIKIGSWSGWWVGECFFCSPR